MRKTRKSRRHIVIAGLDSPANNKWRAIIRLSEAHKKAGAELVSNGIVGRNLGTKQKLASQIPSHNAIVEEFGPVFF